MLKQASIVAIHGIGAHPDDGWSANVGTATSPQWVNWLEAEDMLPAVAPSARIMRYGYQSQWFGESAMRQKVSSVAQRLLLALSRNRKVWSDTLYLHAYVCIIVADLIRNVSFGL